MIREKSTTRYSLLTPLIGFLGVLVGSLVTGVITWQTQKLALEESILKIRAEHAQTELRNAIEDANQYLQDVLLLLQLLDGKAPEEELKAQYSKVTKSGFRLTLTSSNDLAKLTMLLNVHLARKMGADLRIDDTIDKQIGNPDELFGKWIARARLEIALQRSKSAPSDEGIDQLVEILKLLRQ